MTSCRWCSKPCKLTYCSWQCKRADEYSKQKAMEHAQKVKLRRMMRGEVEGNG